MKKFVLVCGTAAAALSLSACATITRGSSQKFNIESSPTQADAKLSTGQTCVTPCTLTLKRKSQFKVIVSKRGYKSQEVEVHGKVKGGGAAGVVGNAIFGGIIGAGVDTATGAALSLDPNPLIVTLVPESAPVAVEAVVPAAVVPAVEAAPAATSAATAVSAPSTEAAAPSTEATAPAADSAAPGSE